MAYNDYQKAYDEFPIWVADEGAEICQSAYRVL